MLSDSQSDAVRMILVEHAEGAPPERGQSKPPIRGEPGGPGGGRESGMGDRSEQPRGGRMSPRDQKVRDLLDDQQKVLFDQLLKEQMETMRGPGGGPGMGPGGRGGPGGPPPGGF